jgi:hypothetical protein
MSHTVSLLRRQVRRSHASLPRLFLHLLLLPQHFLLLHVDPLTLTLLLLKLFLFANRFGLRVGGPRDDDHEQTNDRGAA